jgi:trk system potassium uptake protein TrkA
LIFFIYGDIIDSLRNQIIGAEFMNIIIVGCGAAGSAICSQLTQEGHDITLVDQSSTVLNDACNRFDVFGVVGNGAGISVMKKARTDDADLLIAVTPSDEINILCCLVAKKLGILHTVARVRNPEYSELFRAADVFLERNESGKTVN